MAGCPAHLQRLGPRPAAKRQSPPVLICRWSSRRWRLQGTADRFRGRVQVGGCGLGAAMLLRRGALSDSSAMGAPMGWPRGGPSPGGHAPGTGHDNDLVFADEPVASPPGHPVESAQGQRPSSATSGMLERHPGLHVVFVVQRGLAAVGDGDDRLLHRVLRPLRHHRQHGLGPPGPSGKGANQVITPRLEEHPSFYVRRQVHATFQDDRVGMQNINITGVDTLLWGSDYPHEEGTFPGSAGDGGPAGCSPGARSGREGLPRYRRPAVQVRQRWFGHAGLGASSVLLVSHSDPVVVVAQLGQYLVGVRAECGCGS